MRQHTVWPEAGQEVAVECQDDSTQKQIPLC